ncbi:GNAT family N-acetyltransferase [Actinacidiphila rubida]|uniref:FR47-like protein n=1 Tax=Actinacidiphila rubida TaxID=310780 RepID=A0A1H8J117_9ACTN|nr:GNAT family N-acetyltransferase [Actinacidiphila rubida]SEN73668.1 FR47-like protein [Actinacidiphila rubida]
MPTSATPQDRLPAPHVLDNPVWAALAGPQRHFAEITGRAARFHTDVAPFVAVADPGDPGSWVDMGRLVGPGNIFPLTGGGALPDGWAARRPLPGVQMVGTPALRGETDAAAELLGPADVPEMLELVARTQPGPFLARTIELGAYWGVRDGGRLVAMAGERLRPPGWTEISAVCTDPEHRGRGLAGRLVRQVAVGIRARGDVPFLHAATVNSGAIRLYESLGFTARRSTDFHSLRVPVPARDGLA